MNLKIDLKKEINDSYNIIFTEEIWNELSNFLIENKKKRVLIVSDSNVFPLHYYNLFKNIKSEIEVNKLEIKAWEENKNIEAILLICKKLIEINFNRDDVLIALWWGVVWDIVWMSSSLFKRGIDFIQIPTTLLSMFDSSVWWKTWVDFENIKNIIWSFKQPKLVLINSNFLETLSKEEILSWYFEWLKHSLIKSENYFQQFKNNSNKLININNLSNGNLSYSQINNLIKENVSIKAEIVMQDEKETWSRKFLNYGHTFWHALESTTNFNLSHWLSVWFWMIYINILSNMLWHLSDDNLLKINNFILEKVKYINISKYNLDFENIYEKMLLDKKNNSSDISFILLKKPWKLFIENIPRNKKEILEECFNIFIKTTK